MREQGRSKAGIASLHHVKLAPMSAPGRSGERQEHLDAIIAFAGAGQRRLFTFLDTLTVMCFVLSTQLLFLKTEKDPTVDSISHRSEGVKCVSRRLLALSEGEIATFTASVRHLGVGSQGGADALAISHQIIFDGWTSGTLDTPLARIKVDETNCFGMIEYGAVRNSASNLLPKYAARQLMPKDRGAEQGDVDGPLECIHSGIGDGSN